MHRLAGVTLAGMLALAGVPFGQGPRSADDVIVWSATRKLEWTDFKSKPPPNTLTGALSAISHDYAVGCRDQALQMRVQTIFQPNRSWVSYRIVSSGLASRVGIKHEEFQLGRRDVGQTQRDRLA